MDAVVDRLQEILYERTRDIYVRGSFKTKPTDPILASALEQTIELEYFAQSPTKHFLLVTYKGISSRPGRIFYNQKTGDVSIRTPHPKRAPTKLREEAYKHIAAATALIAKDFYEQNN